MDQPQLTLPEDIFNHLIHIVVADLLHDNYRPPDKRLFTFACSLRLVNRHAHIVLRPYTSPVLELESRRHAAQVTQNGIPSRAAIRSLTFAGSGTTVYCNAILQTLNVYRKLERLVFDDHGTPATTTLQRILGGPMMENISEIAIITSFGIREAVFKEFLFGLSPHPSRTRIRRLAVHGIDLVEGHFPLLETLVVRWDVPSNDLDNVDTFVSRLSSLRRLTIISSILPLQSDPVTRFRKWSYAQRRPRTSIKEVLPPVPEADIPAWFAEQVRSGLIFQLAGMNWADAV